MRVAIIADSIDLQNAGIHVYTLNMIRSMEQMEGIELTCIRLYHDSKIRFKNEIVVPRVISFLEKDPLRLFFSIPRILRQLNPDIVIEPAHFGPFNLPKRMKRVTIIHDLTPILFPQWHNTISQLLQRVFLPSILRKAALVVTNSNNTQNDLHQIYPFTKNKSVRIYPGIDAFYQLEEPQIRTAKEPFFLTTGTIEPRKNLTTLLDAFQQFCENTKSNLKLVICGGKGWKNDVFYQKLESHPFKNRIEVKGYVSKEELRNLYSKTTAFIFPSLYEGFGFPVAEAMGCGAPCIVSQSSSLTEVGGDAVLYFDPNSAQALAYRLGEVAGSTELQTKLIEKGLQQAKQFNWETFALLFETELHQLEKTAL